MVFEQRVKKIELGKWKMKNKRIEEFTGENYEELRSKKKIKEERKK